MKAHLLIVGYALTTLALIYAFFPITVVTALPVYPGAQSVEKHDNNKGYTITFVTTDSPDQVRDFYMKQITRADLPTQLNYGGPWSKIPSWCRNSEWMGFLETPGNDYTIALKAYQQPDASRTDAMLIVFPGAVEHSQQNDCTWGP